MYRDKANDIEQINNAIITGDENAWRKIYNSYYGAIKNQLRKLDVKESIIKDLVHQTFLRLINSKKKPVFENTNQVYAWFIKTAKSTAFDHFKSASQKTEKLINYQEDIELLSIDIPKSSSSKSPTDIKVLKILSLMPERDRKLLQMRTAGTKFKLIAQEIGMQENAARTYYQRAAAKFRKLYLEHFELRQL